ncbi:ATP-dependent helicase HrpB [Gluconacetobacter diazotrophicus]|uniref:Putative ATP-dependent helicase n=1 Tax=Gluconacetobacter diazotrophicus (strain ATCC 49037 / DSM 5601 / CCUG 37298 / CIP 103539 / LMG 7603 / PAl5) TaxID=272568 RepID=A9HFS0_GLUDA|nr:ATP-dependent helicase HrpB [Gluconacetobacter diazotrophicus]CAP55401.1 putative ATP-dependent helicase [Gluconacetobacter diazotrophicus PA1 5]
MESDHALQSPLPALALPADLPVAAILPALRASLAEHPSAVLVAPPGAGKTTTVPLALLDAPWRGDGRIVMLEPRRLAARAAAQRMAALLGEDAGGLVGYRTRLDSAISERTRIEVVTEGLMVRRLLADPTLEGVACVILDEIHERSLDADAALAFCLDVQRSLRPDLRLVAMSATMDGAALSALMEARLIESAGRMFPVAIHHAPRDIPHVRDLPEAMARAIRAALAEHEGDILAFLPGVGEIRRTQAALAGAPAAILPLYGDMPPAEQDRVLRPGPSDGQKGNGRRVILATSSRRGHADRARGSGWWWMAAIARSPRLDPGAGLSRGWTRCGFPAPPAPSAPAAPDARVPAPPCACGREATQRGMAPHDRPEILDAELTGLRLDTAAWQAAMGTAPDELPLPDAPPNGAFEAARALLLALGVDDDARITAEGERMAALGAHPRLAAMMLAARDAGEAALAADIAALLEERDPLRPRPAGGRGAPAVPPADIALRLDLIAGGDHADADRGALARIRQAAGQYRRRLGLRAGTAGQGHAASLLAAAFPDRIAQRRGEPGSFRLSGGGGARLGKTDRLADAGLLAVATLHVRTAADIRIAAALDPDSLPETVRRRATEQVETTLDPVTGSVMARRRLRLGALVLRDRTVAAAPGDVADLLLRQVADRLDTTLGWTPASRQFQARVALARGLPGRDALPDLSDAALAADAAEWLAPWLTGLSRLSEVAALDVLAMLRGRLDHATLAWLDRALPTHLDLPGGRVPVDYTQPVPTASARAQTFYGVRETPRLADGQVGLQVALLSPAGRPQAITADLAGFWAGSWADMRRDMRGRYPRHDWPENPATAAPPARHAGRRP